jgi:hypothetical protein
MDYYFPGIEAKYGFNFTSVRYEVVEIANVTLVEDDQSVSFDGSVNIQLFVMGHLTVDLSLNDLHFDATLEVENDPLQALKVVINEITLKTIRINSSTIGKIDLPLMASFLTKTIGVAMPLINRFLDSRKCVVPENIGGMFSLTDLKMQIHDNYIDLGLTPVLNVTYEKIDERFLPFRPIANEPYYPNPKEGGFNTFFLEQLGMNGDYL